jgi:hypothetical protein
MLNTRFLYTSVINGSLETTRDETSLLSIDAILQHIDEIYRIPSPSTFNIGYGIGTSRGFITIHDRGFILHAYFVDEVVKGASIQIELFGPFGDPERLKNNPYAGTIEGLITLHTLKQAIHLLDKGESPVEYVQSNIVSWPKDKEGV